MTERRNGRREFLKALGLTGLALAMPGCRTARAEETASTTKGAMPAPNFVLILTDDQGWTGSSVRMDPDFSESASDYIETPNLERLAREGIRFAQAYSPAAMCSPSRHAIQFGKTPARLRKTHNYPPDEEGAKRVRDSKAIPQMLKDSRLGYVTAHFGKWHIDVNPETLGYDFSDGPTGNPEGDVWERGNRAVGKKPVPMPPDDPKRIFSLTAKANRFMEEQTAAGKPFYMQVSHYAVHLQPQSLQATLDKYLEKAPGKRHKRPEFAACTEDLDTGIGMVLDKVRELGIKDNTYVFVISDNGALAMWPDMQRVNHPLRRGKFTFFEGGIRVPMFALGPGIKPGSVSDLPVSGCDFLPTIHDLANLKTPLPDGVDGGSLAPVFASPKSGEVNRLFEGLYFHCPNGHGWSATRRQSAIRHGDYKLLKNHYNRGELLLFNVADDPAESKNLVDSMPEKVGELHGMLNRYLDAVGAESGVMTEEELEALDKVEGYAAQGRKDIKRVETTEYSLSSQVE